jgi:hypothetical protein
VLFLKQAEITKMKSIKKISLGLSLVISLLAIFLTIVPAHKTLGLGFGVDPFAGAKYTMPVTGTITVTIREDTQGHTLPLTFSNSTKSPLVYKSQSYFCTTTNSNYSQAITSPPGPAIITLGKAPSGSTISGVLNVWWANTGAGGACNSSDNNKTISITNNDPSTGGSGGLPKTLIYNGATYNLIDPAYPLYGVNQQQGSDCYGGSVMLTNAKATSGTAYLGLVGNGGVTSLKPSLIKQGASSGVINLVPSCGFQDPKANTAGYSGTISSGVLNAAVPAVNGGSCSPPGAKQDGLICGGTDGSSCTSQGCVWAAATPIPTNTSGSCEANFNSGFEWIICGALKLADKAASGFSDFIENQLCFNTGATSSTGGVVCNGNDNLTEGVKGAWAIFKNIASALLVIVLLIMVISQAIGGGLFDAYTVRKMLPKIVAAVILMQLSWVLFKWAIDLSNDLGQAIQSLLFAPFGGANNVQLDKMVGNSVATHSVGTNNTWAFFTVLAAGTAAIANLPGLLTLGLFVVVSLATAFFVLILRKLLIILLIILAPIAFIAWVLPGTERYWKMWRENFVKLLAMFPLIMGLIAGGRIFAYITSGGSQPASASLHLAVIHLGGVPIPYLASVTSFADIAIIVFAYFGPYLMLPKAFSWGGQFMSAAADQVNNRLTKRTMEKGREGVKGITERYQGRRGKAYDPNAFIGNRILNRVGSGHFLPTKRSQRLAIAAGDKWSQERDDQALATIKRRGEKVLAEGYETFARTEDGELAKYSKDAAGNKLKDANGKNIMIKVATKAEADVDKLTGVGAMKQMWVDLAEEGDANERKMAIRQLTATSSWPEVQTSFTKNGKRVIDTADWATSITTSTEDYPRVLRSRVDATPHIEDSAVRALGDQLKLTPGMSSVEQLRFKSQYRIKYAIEKQLDNEGFQTQSDGFWEEAARMASANSTPEEAARGAEIQAALKKRFQAIHDIGGTTPQVLLGHLKNGGPLQGFVETALGDKLDAYIRT